MRGEANEAKLERCMRALGDRVRGEGTIYLTGGATAVLRRWRASTIDVGLKADPEPSGFFEALADLKDELDLNVELASPDQFIPLVGRSRERSLFIARHGHLTFFHYDPYGQALAKLQRGHDRDLRDVRSFVREGLADVNRLRAAFDEIEPLLIRYPAIDSASFRSTIMECCLWRGRGSREPVCCGAFPGPEKSRSWSCTASSAGRAATRMPDTIL